MKKFNELEYKRIDIEKITKETNELIEVVKDGSEEDAVKALRKIFEIQRDVDNSMTLAFVRHSINTNDEFYKAESDFLDEAMPKVQELFNTVNLAIVNGKNKEAIKKEFGEHFIAKIEVALKTFDPCIMEEMVEENKLSSEYGRLLASASIPFMGENRNLSQLTAFYENPDREIREKAWKAYWSFFDSHLEEFDNIYDKMVKVRDKQAKKLGFKDFVELGYYRMGRSDYTYKEVQKYRKGIEKYLVPITDSIIEDKKKRLGLDKLYYYDNNFEFVDGNPKPIGKRDYLVGEANKMYHSISKETGDFFDMMVDYELLDLEAKPGKETGGYCTYIASNKTPFIFSNFNGTSGDVDVLTHEAGHAFQCYSSGWIECPDMMWPTSEAAEIHSMSMEFFAEPYMEAFFGSDANKYRYSHLAEAFKFIPYGVSIDEFQEWVYQNPNVTPLERRNKYREIEKKYMPYKDYKDNALLDSGAYWLRQAHVFESPFYYIDYTLAQLCSLQYLIKDLDNHDEAWKNYHDLCKLGGTKSFLGLVKTVGLLNPFDEENIKKICEKAVEILNNRR